MKKFWFFVFFALTTAAFADDPITGYWTRVDKAGVLSVWEVYVENSLLNGRIIYTSNPLVKSDTKAAYCKTAYAGFPLAGKVNELPVLNTPWIWGLKNDKEGVWSGGKIINVEDGKMYQCKITFHAPDGKKFKSETLEMRGEIGMGIGGSDYWRRATKEETALRNK
ncbi:MAG: DUF2147 domain-containing protein [Treponemataceae bacterium]|nr:MAG: DUF2147 domain-containing protein [Treponemataceae bacterium]